MLNFEEQVKLGVSLLDWNVNEKELKIVDLLSRGIPAVYIYEPTRGGKSIIVGNDGKALVGTSSKSLDQLIEDVKMGKYTKFDKLSTNKQNLEAVTCKQCGNVTNFDKSKIPTGVSFDYICSKCGAFHKIKFAETSNFIDDKVTKAIEYFNQEIFTVEDKKDPTWEAMCQKLADCLITVFIEEGKSYHYIYNALHLNKNDAIEALLNSKGIELNYPNKTKDSVLNVFRKKLEKIDKILREKNNGVKW